jgi:hypothetical protein
MRNYSLLPACGSTSHRSIFQSLNQSRQHSGYLFELRLELGVFRFVDQPAPSSQLEQRHALLDRTPRNAKEILPVRLGEPPIPLGNIRRDGQRGPVQLINEETVPASKLLRRGTDAVREINRLLVDDQLLKLESQLADPEKEKRSEEETRAIVGRSE